MEVAESTVNETDFTAFVADVFKARDYLRQRCQNNEQDADLIELISRMDEFERHVLPKVKGIENVIHKINEGIPSKSEQVLATVLEAVEKHKDEITTLKTKTISTEDSLMDLSYKIRDVIDDEKKDMKKMNRQICFYAVKQCTFGKVLGSVLQQHELLNQTVIAQNSKLDFLQTQVQELSKSLTESTDTMKRHFTKLEDDVKTVTRDQNTETNNIKSDIKSMKKANKKTDFSILEIHDKITAHDNQLKDSLAKIHDLDISTQEKISESQEDIKHLQTRYESIKVKGIENVIYKINEGIPSKSEQVLASVLEAVDGRRCHSSVDDIDIRLKDMALQSVTVGLVAEVSEKQKEIFDSVNKKCDEMVKRIEIQDKKVDEVKAELSQSVLESSTKSDLLLKQLDGKILTEEKIRCDDVKKVASEISLIKETNQKRDNQLEKLFMKNDDCEHQRTHIFVTVGELEKKTCELEENLLLGVGNLKGSVDKLHSEVSKQDETVKGQQVKLEELKVNLDKLSKSLTVTEIDFNNKLEREIKNGIERFIRVEDDILLIKDSNKITDSKLAELKKENDENQKTLQNSLKDLNLKVMDIDKEIKGITKKQDTMEQLTTSVTEKQKKSIANVKVTCDILDFKIKEQEKKSTKEKIDVSKRLSEFTTQFTSQVQLLDNKIETETKNINDQYKTNHGLEAQ
ncbi:myosin-1-like [Physella acuta]|uniref:myosin-1-like n=1 Tax=Physella acuta TaxID=109671 RepID=UPI0027DAC9A1|nr:myosin-1-like [Physella acuta]